MKEREIKIKREIEVLFFKQIFVPIEDMNKFEKKKKKVRSVKNTWYEWLIGYIPEPITKKKCRLLKR